MMTSPAMTEHLLLIFIFPVNRGSQVISAILDSVKFVKYFGHLRRRRQWPSSTDRSSGKAIKWCCPILALMSQI